MRSGCENSSGETAAGSAVTIDGASYTLDNAGNRTAKTDQRTSVATSYGYDNLYQLLSATQGAITTESYTYDAVGNRLSDLTTSGWSNNTSNELSTRSGVSYTFDNSGNELTKVDSAGTTSYTWDFENRLTQVTLPASGGTVSFSYDPFGRRIKKSSSAGTSIYAFDGDNLIEETNASGAVVARYSQTENIDEPLAMLRSGTASYYQSDGLNSVSSLSSTAGALAQTYTFDSFGKTMASSGSITNPFQYTGRELDSETMLYFMRARYFDPATGRFISEDPIMFAGGANFYRYSRNNPVVLIDPFGLTPGAPAIPFPWVHPYPIVSPWARAIGGVIGAILGELIFPDATARDEDLLKRKPVPCSDKKRDCEKEWAEAYEMCRKLLSKPHPPRALTGGYTDLANCAKGLVSEECGGNPVSRGVKK